MIKQSLLTFSAVLGITAAAQAQLPCNMQFDYSLTPELSYPYQVTFNNKTSKALGPGQESRFFFNYGDNSQEDYNRDEVVHNYPTAGTYRAYSVHIIYDSLSNRRICVDTLYKQVIVPEPPPPNIIYGSIHDSTTNAPPPPDSMKVWLIRHDANQNTLYAVDSTVTYFDSRSAGFFSFRNKAPGNYLLKAALKNPSASSFDWVPTYHDSSLYWSGAATIVHTGGRTGDKNIKMQIGAVLSGPGFIGGNISMGAGRGTSTGVPGMLVFLRDNNNKVLAATYTDEDGNYTFENIPTGPYNIYPEAINYTSTPSATIQITTNETKSDGINFEQTADGIVPTNGPLSISGIQKQDGVSIYPNPVQDKLVIENKSGLFRKANLVNALGQVIQQQDLSKGRNEMTTGSLPPGLYYLMITGDNSSRLVKITKS